MREKHITAISHLNDREPFVVFYRGLEFCHIYHNLTCTSLQRMSQVINIIGGPYYTLANGWIWYRPMGD